MQRHPRGARRLPALLGGLVSLVSVIALAVGGAGATPVGSAGSASAVDRIEVTPAAVDAVAPLAWSPWSSPTPPSSGAWRGCHTTLAGVRVWVREGQRSVTIVNGSGGSYAKVSFYLRTRSACSFVKKFSTTGRVGYGGITTGSTRKQGTGTTPTGTYSMTEGFGLKADPGSWVKYRRVRTGDFWVEDNASKYYNNYRNVSQGGFRSSLPASNKNGSERLTDYPGQYDYALVINFNRKPYSSQKAYRGAGIFVHVKGKGATAGCVSLTRDQMRTMLAYVRSGDRITIVK